MSKYEKIERTTIELALESVEKNITWLAAEMGYHFNTVYKKIRMEDQWTRAEVELLVKILGDEVIDVARADDRLLP